MDFPAYVPSPVRLHLTAAINGEFGLQPHLDKATATLDGINFQIESCTRWGKDGYLRGLTMDRTSAMEHQARLADELRYLQRLANDARMQPAFTALTGELTEDDQWLAFIKASCAARDNFNQYRNQLRQAREASKNIAATAKELAVQLGDFAHVGLMGPDAFFSIPALLRQTDNTRDEERNLHMWRSLRGHILGEPPLREPPDSDPEWTGPVEIGLVPFSVTTTRDIERENADALRYAWGTAPRVQDLLTTLSEVAQGFTPKAPNEIAEAAIASRKQNKAMEYLRAFWHLLEANGFTKTPAVKNAMAVTATVALNEPDTDVTYNDVRNAIE